MVDRAAPGLAVRDLVIAPGASAITQTIAPGEIVGLAGLDGHGQELFLKMLAGLAPPLGGSIEMGASRKITGFRKAVASGVAYLPRDRRKARYDLYREKLSIVAPRPDAPITTLSGGNQQKVLLARALALEPAILLLNDPTRGVDVATRHVLYDVFRGLAADGMGLVILSSEIEEILLLCQRVLVFRENEVAAEIAGDALTTDSVISAMFGRAA
ncbi:MAG: sugar ABC transporter ATP-binding protein [Mesorhizobium sp.]|uniref:ATP-binding cassette domain-containing protein n=1 Tax=Mesorhizobium sp. TaxID=1871066 RepID=UPI001218C133|nr:ATP-binding cassette domain-containing protein [Mesorhizobium sp.]TIN96108.1 MAG: sugar ABC transporter ATP-binding protein [Mesorhizobium sp.]TJU99571.1 MAG: sugar ABC transporter ATP-binding protein [Mesorhizobium sp.]